MNRQVLKMGRKVLKRQKPEKQDNPNSANILYEWKEDKKGKITRVERESDHEVLGISENDAEVLRRVRKKAYRYDQGFKCCCTKTRYGWSAIIGLIPVIGDIIEILMALSLVRAASKIDGGFGWGMWFMMIGNIALDFGLGFIPVAGDLVDFFYRANTRNAWMFEDYLFAKAYARATDEGYKYDVEQGAEQPETAQAAPVAPATVRPAQMPASRPEMAPQSRSGNPGRSLTGQGGTGHRQDPRDRGGPGGRAGRR